MNRFGWSQEQLAQFNRDGYYMARGLFDAQEMQLLIDIARADKAMAEAGSMEDAQGGKSKIKLTFELEDDIYSAFVHSPRIIDPMEQLIGESIYHWHHKMMLKEPLVGGAWEWHQDYGYWYGDKCLWPKMASCMIAVDRASKENGCLQVLRGSHLIGRVEHGRFGGQAGADPERVKAAQDRLELVHCEMEPGTALFFHGNLLHSSAQNRSPNPRWSLICCYNALSNAPYEGRGHGKAVAIERWENDTIKQVGQRQWEVMQAAV